MCVVCVVDGLFFVCLLVSVSACGFFFCVKQFDAFVLQPLLANPLISCVSLTTSAYRPNVAATNKSTALTAATSKIAVFHLFFFSPSCSLFISGYPATERTSARLPAIDHSLNSHKL